MTRARAKLIEEVITSLDDAGFELSSTCDVRPTCFDLVARKGDKLILIKVLDNIGALTREDAITLQLVAHFFNATPLVIGRKTSRGPLLEGVVYKRYGVSAIAPSSFTKIILEEQMPRVFSQRGGRLVVIDGKRLKQARLSKNMTQEELAGCVRVSARVILAYEHSEMDASLDVAQELERVLETDLIIPIDLMGRSTPPKPITTSPVVENVSELEQKVNEFFERLGMKVLWTDRAPFHVAAKEKSRPLISGVGSLRSWTLKKRVDILRSVSDITKSDAVLIVNDGVVEECVADLPVIRQVELQEIDKSHELRKIIAERSGQ